ncbi:MAG: ATP-binding protein [Planctomycetaceae bacterium]
MTWFDVDRQGLSAILERRGKAFAIYELIQNAWDSGSDRVDVRIDPIPGQPYATIEVEDWGDGFADLRHAYTMFARSTRAGDATKRGRFNFGEKLVLAICRTATIVTTTGSLIFGETRRRGSEAREAGTLFRAEIRMTRDELAEVREAMHRLIPPVRTNFNGTEIDRLDPLVMVEAKLPTEIADAEGQLRRTVRTAIVEVHEAVDSGDLLELGIPVVETDNGYRVNVQQKVPLNFDRDNVTPAYLRTINALLLNHVHDRLTPETAAAPWAQEAVGDSRAKPEAIKTVLAKRFGDRAVIATPGDPVANATAEATGHTVIPGGALSGDAWANVKKHGLLLPASKVFPSPSPEAVASANAEKCPLCGK